MSSCILEEFPTCCITVTSLDTSVSGFAVVFVLHEQESRMRATFLVLLVLATLIIVSIYVFHTVRSVLPFFPSAVWDWAVRLCNSLLVHGCSLT